MEGRNGQLSLRHHGLHRLTTRKLGALGVLHNYLAKRPDGTTAAERFFGARPKPLMPWLLSRLPLPAHTRRGDAPGLNVVWSAATRAAAPLLRAPAGSPVPRSIHWTPAPLLDQPG